MAELEVGFGYPFRLDETRMRPVIDDFTASLRSSVRAIVMTDPSERPFRIKNGVPFGTKVRRFLFNSDDAAIAASGYEIRKALAVWEPRIRVRSVDVTITPPVPGQRKKLNIRITYIIVSSNRIDDTTLSLEGGS